MCSTIHGHVHYRQFVYFLYNYYYTMIILNQAVGGSGVLDYYTYAPGDNYSHGYDA